MLSHLLKDIWLSSGTQGIWVLFCLLPDFREEALNHRALLPPLERGQG